MTDCYDINIMYRLWKLAVRGMFLVGTASLISLTNYLVSILTKTKKSDVTSQTTKTYPLQEIPRQFMSMVRRMSLQPSIALLDYK